ncbi:Gfo/Idh/MocA family protein [Solwaraspora sp. WMMB335]|uniref:Gfo/Idh/MocA family protein n=1 Tax=Solwaraspora sp. WMMB335 TaxID=3404118 RepID=UPI003B947081
MTAEPPVEELQVLAPRSWSTVPRIAIAGVGGVAHYAHLPAYRQLGVRVVALHDPSAEALARVGRDVPEAVTIRDPVAFAERLPELGVDLLDVAVPSPNHADFLQLLLDTCGADCPPLLVQKPLAPTSEAAARIVARADELGVQVAVHLNGRWVPTFRAARELLRSGALGPAVVGTLLNRGWNPKRNQGWRARIPRLIGYEMAVHHVDLLVWAMGQPSWVVAAMRPMAGLGAAGDSFASATFGFGPSVITVIEDWTCRDEAAHRFHPTSEELTISGAAGTLLATPAELRLTTPTERRHWRTRASWFPDAFAGPPAEFLCALAERRPTTIEARQHVAVLRVLDAMYESADRGQVVHLTGPASAVSPR